MNKKIILALSVIIAILLLNVEISCADTPLKKLGRGVANVVTSPLEIIKGVSDANEESGPFAGFTWGIFSGIFKTGVRAVVGVYEIGTFLIPLPKNYGPILKNPEFFWEEGMY